jgi:hypothetical protein
MNERKSEEGRQTKGFVRERKEERKKAERLFLTSLASGAR